jgi:hypothetical protein
VPVSIKIFKIRGCQRWCSEFRRVPGTRGTRANSSPAFYVTKTVLVDPKWFWSDQIDLDLTIMIWSRPKWIGQVQMWFILAENHNLDPTNSFSSWLFHFGGDQIIMVKSKSIWSYQNHFGHTKTILDRPKLFWTRHKYNWLCVQKMLNHGLNNRCFLLLLKRISCPIHWIVYVLAKLNSILYSREY